MTIQPMRISSEDAERCAAACRAFVEQLRVQHRDVSDFRFSSAFGTLPSGRALNKKYSELTNGGPGSLSAMLQGHIDVATKLADTFTEMGRNYEATDDAVAHTISGTNPPG